MIALSSRSLWALAAYRYGRWTYSLPSGPISLPAKLVYHLVYLLGQHTSKIAIDVNAEIGQEVFIAPVGLFFVGPDVRVGRGSYIHGQVTLGVGGRPGARGLPLLGDRVHVGPGTMLVGPLSVPDDTVIGPNSVVTRTLPAAGGWLGSPARPYDGPVADLIPAWTGTWRRNDIGR
jgi:serine O-acetyltransferase